MPAPRIITTTVLLMMLISGAHAETEDPIRFVIPSFKPYTYQENYELKGIGVDKVTEVMKVMRQTFTLKLVPNYGRALKDLTKNSADGFFLASENPERNQVAVFSDPLMINRWSWFFIRESPTSTRNKHFKTKTKIGTFLHANTHKWLIKNNYSQVKPVLKTELLPEMLLYGRVQGVFIAEMVFHNAVKKNNMELIQFRQEDEISKPFGIYISNSYLKDHPGFMDKLNAAIALVNAR